VTEAQALEALAQRWVDVWPTLQPGAPYSFEGETSDAAPTWARVTFRPLAEDQATLGRPARFEHRGMIFVQLFADLDQGRAPLDALVESVREVFAARAIAVGSEEITTYAGPARSLPSDGRWLMAVMSIPYWFDEQR